MNRIWTFLKDTGEKIRLTHPVRQLTAFAFFALLVTIAFFRTVALPDTVRSLFFYPNSFTHKVEMEVRHLPRLRADDDRLSQYLDELLFGPVMTDHDPIFSGLPRVESAFIRGHDAYVNITAEALERGSGEIPWPAAYELFKKNVFTNFRNIARIYLYIDGQEVYADDSSADATTKK